MDEVGYKLLGIVIVMFSIPLWLITFGAPPLTTDFQKIASHNLSVSVGFVVSTSVGIIVSEVPWIRRTLRRIMVNREIGRHGGD